MTREDPILELAKRVKNTGISKEEYLDRTAKSYKAAAKQDGWRPSELAATLAHVTEVADVVWGKDGSL